MRPFIGRWKNLTSDMPNYRFGIYTIARILIILGLCITFGFIFGDSDLFFSQIIVLSLIVLLSFELIRFVNRTNRELTKLVNAIRHRDYSANFSQKKLGRSFDDLAEAFSEVIRSFRNIKIEKEAQLQLLQLIIDQINVGIVAVKEGRDLIFMNKKAVEILELPGLHIWNIDLPLIRSIEQEIGAMKTQGNKLLELQVGNEVKQLAFHMNETIYLEDELRLMTFHDIRSEIEQKEIEAWYKLIRILTHEVMNSITPLSSLTETVLMLLQEKDGSAKDISAVSNEHLEDIRSSLKTIQGRSEGILEFVDAYRRLTNIPHPEFEPMSILEAVKDVRELLKADLDKRQINVSIDISPENLSIQADNNLIQQVLINLITNSMYALEGTNNPRIDIRAEVDKSHTFVEVIDNGKGIEKEKIDKIFIPFYSTREGGSGIGLSLSKQIVHLHHGRLKVRSSPGKGTTFRIEF